MAGKKAKQQQSLGGNSDEAATKREQPLQAVLLADSFLNTFRPLSLDKPKVLCPLNNVTMIDYAFDFLAGSGVEEVIVVCVNDAVETHLLQDSSTWGKPNNHSMAITVVKDASLTNAGDALRELDRRDLVQSDPFILMFGDVVTNVDVSAAIESHKVRHKKDRSNMMTLLFKPIGAAPSHHASSTKSTASSTYASCVRAHTDDLLVGLNPSQENRILVYSNTCAESSVTIPCSFFAAHPAIDLRYDLLDCGIDICSPDVLARFTDEFDYREIRRKFVANSVAEEEEGLQNKIFAHLLGPHEYAARVHDFSTYAAISRDLLQRWCYPVVPDDHLPSGYERTYRYALQRRHLYVEQNQRRGSSSQIHRSTQIQGPGMIGANVVIGKHCRLHQSVVGHSCRLGDHVQVQDSHVWDNVVMEDNVQVMQSVLAEGCVLKAGAIISRGCIIGAGCVIGPGVLVPEFSRITLKDELEDDFGDDWDDEEDEDDEEEEEEEEKDSSAAEPTWDTDLVGADGKGRLWQPPPEDDEDEELYGLTTREVNLSRSIGFNPTELYLKRRNMQQEPGDDFSDRDEDGNDSAGGANDYYGDAGVDFSAGGGLEPFGRQKDVDVVAELKAICLEYEPSTPIENLAIELNSFKFSQNASYSDCTMAATLAILEQMNITASTKDGKMVGDFKAYLEQWTPLLHKMSIGLDEEKAIVEALEMSAVLVDHPMGEKLRSSKGRPFRFLLQTLHDEEIVSEEALLSWAAIRRKEQEEQGEASPRIQLFAETHVQEFLQWLEEESEDDDDEDDDDDEEDE